MSTPHDEPEATPHPARPPRASAAAVDGRLARRLVLDELFDLSLYQSLRDVSSGELRVILDRLIPIERRHFAFWQECS